jgi:hypothetical protein
MDTIDNCRMRLLALRTRIETNWPQGGGFLRRGGGLTRDAQTDIADLLVALPTPLPLHAGGDPETIICDKDTDLRAVAGRAVDAGLALLEGATLETPYPHAVSMLQSCATGAPEPIRIEDPTVGLLVATIIGALEAVSERVNARGAKDGPRSADAARPVAAKDPPAGRGTGALPSPEATSRGKRVPRI